MTPLERLFAIGPVRKAIWRLWYPFLTRRLQHHDQLFLNYAFQTDPPVNLPLEAEDERFRPSIQLYHHVASLAPLAGRDVLEISCGHGGGASWLTRTYQPRSYTALDLNPAGIAFCKQRHSVSALEFLQGDACHLPFGSESFDIVVNVEASHCYPDFPGFLAEVTRVLRPHGSFLYADFRFSEEQPGWLRAIKQSSLSVHTHTDISAEVLRGMNLNADHSRQLVATSLPRVLRSLGSDFAGIPGGSVHQALASGDLSYQSWHLQKA